MKLVVNGATYEHSGDGTLGALLSELRAVPERVAVIVNGQIVPRHLRGDVALKEGDRVELVTLAGGG